MYSTNLFREKAWNHLEFQKKSTEIIHYDLEDEKYQGLEGKHNNTHYGHIFPCEVRNEYIGNRFVSKYIYLYPFRSEILDYVKRNLEQKINSLCNHMNSSQNLVFNFIIPVIDSKYETDFAFALFNVKGTFELEKSMSDKVANETGTEVDFIIRSSNNAIHLFEAKYTEDKFASVIRSDKYLNKWKKTTDKYRCIEYSKIARYFKKEISQDFLGDKGFYYNNYQLIRNLYNTLFFTIEDSIIQRPNFGTMNVIVPSLNQNHHIEYNRFVGFLLPKYRSLSRLFTWEELCEKAVSFFKNKDSKYAEYYHFLKKYYFDF